MGVEGERNIKTATEKEPWGRLSVLHYASITNLNYHTKHVQPKNGETHFTEHSLPPDEDSTKTNM